MDKSLCGFHRQGHHFRDEISIVYMEMRRLLEQAYGADFAKLFEWKYSGSNVGYLSNMIVVYIWTMFEELMRNAFVTVHSDHPPKEDDIRKNNSSWGKMRKWLSGKDIFTSNLKTFEPLIAELGARRNCLVHNRGIADTQYISQTSKYEGIPAFKLGEHVWTSWDYHEQLGHQLISFQMLLSAAVETHLRHSSPL